MVIVKSKLFNSDEKNKYLLTLMLFLEVNKNFLGKVLFSVNMFLSMFNINPSKANILLVKEALAKLKEMNIIKIKHMSSKDKIGSVDEIKLNTPLFITVFYTKEEFRQYEDEFIFHVLEELKEYKHFNKIIELYLYIMSKMFYDSHGGFLPKHISYQDMVDNTSSKSKTTVASYIKILEEHELLEFEKKKSDSSDNYFNIYTIPNDLIK